MTERSSELVEALTLGSDDVVILRTSQLTEVDEVTLSVLSQKLGERLLLVLPEGANISAVPRVTLLKELGCECGEGGCVTA